MSQVDDDARYSQTHEWAKREEADLYVVGISDHAQGLLGDVVFVELPEVGREVKAGEEISVIESVKAASDIYTPLSGEVIEVNDSLNEQPDLVNSDAFHDGWIFKIKPYDLGEWEEMLVADVYSEQVAQEEGA
jgi:glycine cleavage system H protein